MSDKNDPTIKAQLARLSELVAWFESDDFRLEDAPEKFKEAEKLARQIDADLQQLSNTITVLKKDFSTQ